MSKSMHRQTKLENCQSEYQRKLESLENKSFSYFKQNIREIEKHCQDTSTKEHDSAKKQYQRDLEEFRKREARRKVLEDRLK